MNDYRELQSYLSHSKNWRYIPDEKHKNGDDWIKTLYVDRDGHITGYNRGSKAGMPTNLKKESSNTKRASERAKFMNQLQQVCRSIKTLDEQLGQTGKTQLGLYERKEVSSPNGGKSLVSGLKNGGKSGANTANTELGKLRQQYSAKVAPLEKQLHNLLNAGKNSPLFTDAEKEKMRKWMQAGGTLSELATVYGDIFGSVAHSELDNYLAHGYEAAMHNKKRDMESIKRARYTDKKKNRLEFKKDVNEIDALIKDYEDKEAKGANASTLSKLANQIIDRVKKNWDVFGYTPVRPVDWAIKHGADESYFSLNLSHSSLEEDNMSNEYTEINAYLQHGWFTDLFKSKPNYASTGSRAGMPSNIHLGDSTNPGSKASAIQDELIRMNKKLVEYKSGQEKAKAEYDRYRKLAKDTENRIRDLERSRDAAIKDSVNYKGRQTTVASSAPDKTKLMRTNPIFDAAAAEAAKRLKKRG